MSANINVNRLFREAENARGGGNGKSGSSNRGKKPMTNPGMGYFCEDCGGQLIESEDDDRLVCIKCGHVSNHIAFSTFDSGNLPPTVNRPQSGQNPVSGGKGGKKTFGPVDPVVKRQQDIKGLVEKVYQQAGYNQPPSKDLINLVAQISEARDYTPREDPSKYAVGTIVEGREGVEYVVAEGKGVEKRKVWKLADPKEKVPHRLRGIVILELVGIIRYITGVSMETVQAFWNAASNKPPKNGFVVLRKLMKDDGVSQILSPMYRLRREKAIDSMKSYYPEKKLFSREDEIWIRKRVNVVSEEMTVSNELAIRGTMVLYDLVRTMKCIHLKDCLKRFSLTKRQWEEFLKTAKTKAIFKSDLKHIEP